jgi:hypothetical protein
MASLEETNSFGLLEIQMTEVLERPLPAIRPTRIGRRRRNSVPRSAWQTSPARPRLVASITDPDLTTKQYNEMLANVVRTVQPVGM